MKRQLSSTSDDERPKKVQKIMAAQSASGSNGNEDQAQDTQLVIIPNLMHNLMHNFLPCFRIISLYSDLIFTNRY